MKPTLRSSLAALPLVFVLGGCAVSGPGVEGTPAPRAMPAARQSLDPSFRPIYDELQPYGQWTLIEPYGFCFKPRVNEVAWRPYDDGYWEASDLYGWVWISNEPFGWITYHYGRWFYDRFQHWVWSPGYQWGPAWVAWVGTGDLYGWAPLPPSGFDQFASIPDGLFSYTTASQLAQGAAMPLAVSAGTVASRSDAALEVVLNLGDAGGVVFNRGPAFADVERASSGALPRTTDAPLRVADNASGDPVREEAQLVTMTRRVAGEGIRELDLIRAGRSRVAPRLGPARPAGRPPVRGRVVTVPGEVAGDSLRMAPRDSAGADEPR